MEKKGGFGGIVRKLISKILLVIAFILNRK